MSSTIRKELVTFGISPCPNDTFIMYALIEGIIDAPIIHTIFADVQELNEKILSASIDIGKISVATYPYVAKEYSILCSGGALGLSCGPVIVSKKYSSIEEIKKEKKKYSIGIPGTLTTANALLTLYGNIFGTRTEMPFEKILPAVQRGILDFGLIIHEGRFEYEKYALHKIIDLGDFWEEQYGIPLPLGIIVMKRSLGSEYKEIFEKAIQKSLDYAYANREETLLYCKKYSQTMEDIILKKHIHTFVNEYSMDLGKKGFSAIRALTGVENPHI
ncbi:MAG: 1,4-dihydroxy-6-naphthoate synthase [Desulfovibrionaceae bacterium]